MKKGKVKINGVTYWHPQLSNVSSKAKIGTGTIIHAGVHIHDEVVIGKYCQIEAGVMLFNGVTIEDEVFLAPGVIVTNDRDLAQAGPKRLDASGQRIEQWKPTATLIKKGARIGAGARILAGVTIGRNSLVGMGSVVLKNVGDNETWVGNPARKLHGYCDSDLTDIGGES